MKLPCPVSNGMFMEWLHNGKTVSEATSDVTLRFEGRSSFLRINSPRLSSSGLYTCRVANGFGSLSLNMTLIVLGPNGTTDSSGTPQPGDEPPQFTSVDIVNQEVGAAATVRLRCRARGKPQPSVKWFVNGAELIEERALAAVRGTAFELSGQQLRLDSLKAADSGGYTCLVHNRAGSVNHTYLLAVHEPSQSSPDRGPSMQPPANGSFSAGEAAVLQCYVNSATVPRIRWLKEASEQRCDLVEGTEAPEIIGGRDFVHVKRAFYTHATLAQPNLHLGKLHILSIRPEHAGVYLCQATVGSQVLYREAYIKVVTDEAEGGAPGRGDGGGASGFPPLSPPPYSSSSPSWPYVFGSQSATLAVIVAVPSLIAILVAIVVIYTVNKRKQERRAHDAKQKRLLLRHDGGYHQQPQQQQGPCGGGGGGAPPYEVSISPDFAFEEKASSGGGSGGGGGCSAAMVYRPTAAPPPAATLLGGAAPLLLPPPPAAGQHLLSAAYSCSDGSYHSFIQQQQQTAAAAAYYGQQLHGGSFGGGGSECALSSSSSDSESHFSSVSRCREGRRVPQPPRFAQPTSSDYEDYAASSMQRSCCPPPPPPSVY